MNSNSQPQETNPSPVPQDLTTRTVQSLLWLLSSNAVGALARLAIVPVLARLLAPEVFGISAAASIVSGFAYILTSIGIGPVLIRMEQIENGHIKTGQTISLAMGLIAGLIALLIAPWVAAFFDNAELITILRVQAFLFPLRGFTIVSGALLQRNLDFRRLAIIETVAYVGGYCIIAVGGALAGWGIWAIVAGIMGNELVRVILLIQSRPQAIQFGLELGLARTMLRDGSGFTAMRTLSHISSQVDYMIVGRLLGLDILGLYTKAFELISRPASTLTNTISRPLFAGLVTIQNEQARVQRVFLRGTRILGLVLMPLIPFGVILSPEIVLVVLGSQWVEAIVPFGILMISLFFILSQRTIMIVLQARGALLRGTFYWLFHLVVLALGAWIGHYWGIIGVAAGVTTAFAAGYLLASAIALQNLQMGWLTYLAAYRRSLLLAMLSIALVWPTAYWMRSFDQPFLTLLVTLAVCSMVALLLLVSAPKLVLGAEAEMVMSRLHTLLQAVRTLLARGSKPQQTPTPEVTPDPSTKI